MKNIAKIAVIVAFASAVLIFGVLSRDSMGKAANRVGNAVIKADSDEIWKFVGKKERTEMGLSEDQFKQFWGEFVAPRLKGLTRVEFIQLPDDATSIMIADQKLEKGMLLKVSGNPGEYYCPFLFASTCNACAIMDFKGETKDFQSAPYKRYGEWYQSNKQSLEKYGIVGLSTNGQKGFRSIDEIVLAFSQVGQ